MGKVFISYSTPDIDYAVRVYQYLKMNNVEYWFAPADIASGQNFADEIGRTLGWNQLKDEVDEGEMRIAQSKAAQAMVLLLSKNATKSRWVKKKF